jgi:hypothetical protein
MKMSPEAINYLVQSRFDDMFKENEKDNEKIINNAWQQVKECYYRLHEWFTDDELYHLIGYCLLVNIKDYSLPELFEKAENKTKNGLKKDIRKAIKTSFDNISLDDNNENKTDKKQTSVCDNNVWERKNFKS